MWKEVALGVIMQFVGTGHPDTSKWEWGTNMHRDTNASLVGHKDQLLFLSIGENVSRERMRVQLIERMLQPCGPPPAKPEWEQDK